MVPFSRGVPRQPLGHVFLGGGNDTGLTYVKRILGEIMRFVDSRSPTNPLAAIGGDLRASLAVEPSLPDAINRLTAALERAETRAPDARQSNEGPPPEAERNGLS